jgi:hypothetical protein
MSINRDNTVYSETILSKAVTSLNKLVTINHDYDIPYLAGYSKDGATIYIDRHIPLFPFDGEQIDTTPFLVTHEAIEKALTDKYRLNYEYAHQIALRAERGAVEAAGVDWNKYDNFMKKWIKADAHEKIKSIPDDLDLGPYVFEKDTMLLATMKKAMK